MWIGVRKLSDMAFLPLRRRDGKPLDGVFVEKKEAQSSPMKMKMEVDASKQIFQFPSVDSQSRRPKFGEKKKSAVLEKPIGHDVGQQSCLTLTSSHRPSIHRSQFTIHILVLSGMFLSNF